jgi:YegS/Rv2252/BmrU family lipid kinase|tara:strand:- start:80669 stop:81493 length:825 start_codon:yes stop_codon:yes gene_type:complete
MFPHAKEALQAAGATLVFAEAVPRPDRISAAIDTAIAKGATRLVIGGGDGTISSSAKQIADAGVEMSMLPLGTANSFARTIEMPLDVEGACRMAVTGDVHLVDLGRLGDYYFTNAAAIGLPAEIGRSVPDGLKRIFGRLAYLIWAIYKLLKFKGFTCTIDDGTGIKSYEVVEVRIANGRYLGGLIAVPDADPEDHRLTVQLVRGVSGWQLAHAWAYMATGDAPQAGEVTELIAKRFEIVTDPPQPVSIDGEVLAQTPTLVGLAPGVLKLVVPAA